MATRSYHKPILMAWLLVFAYMLLLLAVSQRPVHTAPDQQKAQAQQEWMIDEIASTPGGTLGLKLFRIRRTGECFAVGHFQFRAGVSIYPARCEWTASKPQPVEK